jgi:hypothetical protein
MIEIVGMFRNVAFEVSTRATPGTYSIDGRQGLPLPVSMSAMDFRIMLVEHQIETIVFAWDIRARAREIFFILAEGFDSFITTERPREVAA